MAIKRLLLFITFGIVINTVYAQEGSIVENVDTNGLITTGTGPNRPLYLSAYYNFGFTLNGGDDKLMELGSVPGTLYGLGLLGKVRLNRALSLTGGIDYTRYSNFDSERSTLIFHRGRQMWNNLNYVAGLHISFQKKRGNILGPFLSIYAIWSHSMVAKQRIRQVNEVTDVKKITIYKGSMPTNRLSLGYGVEFGLNRMSIFYQSINNDWSVKYESNIMFMTNGALGFRIYLN
ncbi:MAG: hypothetical protein JXQ87_09280 [Bacteroidia bacterium]